MRRTLFHFVPIAVASLAISSSTANAASFDCSKAGTPVERMVCEDPELSSLDDVLADAYREALSAVDASDQLMAEQREWLRTYRDRCATLACLRTVYQHRIAKLHDLGGFTAANGMSEDALAAFLEAELNLPGQSLMDQPRIMFAPIRSASETAARRIAFFVGWIADGPHIGIVDVSAETPRVIRWEPYECYCEMIGTFRTARLVAAEPDFIVTEFIPRTGTCVAHVPMRILRIDERGTFETVWEGTTYSAGGPPAVAEVADISFPDLRTGADRGILRSARVVLCGPEDCFCEEGTLIRAFVEFFVWDAVQKRFRPAD